MRECDEQMQAECPHASMLHDNCPLKCNYAACTRPSYAFSNDPDLVFSTAIDRKAPVKDGCMYCKFFHEHGPKPKPTQ